MTARHQTPLIHHPTFAPLISASRTSPTDMAPPFSATTECGAIRAGFKVPAHITKGRAIIPRGHLQATARRSPNRLPAYRTRQDGFIGPRLPRHRQNTARGAMPGASGHTQHVKLLALHLVSSAPPSAIAARTRPPSARPRNSERDARSGVDLMRSVNAEDADRIAQASSVLPVLVLVLPIYRGFLLVLLLISCCFLPVHF